MFFIKLVHHNNLGVIGYRLMKKITGHVGRKAIMFFIACMSVFIYVNAPVSARAVTLGYTGSALWAGPVDIEVRGNYAYTAYWNGMRVFEMTDINTPTPIGEVYIQGTVEAIKVAGNFAYLASGDAGLVIVDISNRANLILAGSYKTAEAAKDIFIDGSYAYVAAEQSLEILDVSVPSAPALVKSLKFKKATHVYIHNGVAFVTDDLVGLIVIDVSSPANPSLINSYKVKGRYSGITVQAPYLYVTDRNLGLYILDISNQRDIKLVNNYYEAGSDYFDISVIGNIGYLMDLKRGLRTLDITDPMNLVQLGVYDSADWSYNLYVDGQYCYVADGWTGGLLVLDVQDPALPMYVSQYFVADELYDVEISGDYLYAMAGRSGLHIVDISNAAAPRYVGNYAMPGPEAIILKKGKTIGRAMLGVDVNGTIAYAADGGSGLKIIDVSDPANPLLLGSFATAGAAIDVQVRNHYAVVAEGFKGIEIVDVSDPANPVLAGTYNTSGYSTEIAIQGQYIYISSGFTSLEILDATDPLRPRHVGSYNATGYVASLSVSGSYAYLADYLNGLEVIDISLPSSPVKVGSYPLKDALGVFVKGLRAFVTADKKGLYVLDVSDAASPAYVADYNTPGAKPQGSRKQKKGYCHRGFFFGNIA